MTTLTERVLNRRLQAILNLDIDGVMQDVAADVVLFRADGPIVGYDNYMKWYLGALKQAPRNMDQQFVVIRKDVVNEIAYVQWQLSGIRGSDTFLVRDGLIAYQTVSVCTND